MICVFIHLQLALCRSVGHRRSSVWAVGSLVSDSTQSAGDGDPAHDRPTLTYQSEGNARGEDAV